MMVELRFSHKLCLFTKDKNETEFCDHVKVMSPDLSFMDDLRLNLSKMLEIEPDRIMDLKSLEYVVAPEPIIPIITNTFNQTFNNANRSLNQLVLTEHLKVSFRIKDKNLFANDKKESILLFYYLNLLAMTQTYQPLLIENHLVSISEVSDLTTSGSSGSWCNQQDEEKIYIRDDFQIFAKFSANNTPAYFVYVNQTDTLYATGDFYLTVLIMPKLRPDFKRRKINYQDGVLPTDHLASLTDVTELILERNTSSALTNKLLIVCDRKPKIRVECVDHKTVRIGICELMKMKDKSFCNAANKKPCFKLDEYEFDEAEPDKYIRVCEHHIYNESAGEDDGRQRQTVNIF